MRYTMLTVLQQKSTMTSTTSTNLLQNALSIGLKAAQESHSASQYEDFSDQESTSSDFYPPKNSSNTPPNSLKRKHSSISSSSLPIQPLPTSATSSTSSLLFSSYSKGTCTICLQLLTVPTYLHPCLHTFCGICIRMWISFRPTAKCPLCRQLVRELVEIEGSGIRRFDIYDIQKESTTEGLDEKRPHSIVTIDHRRQVYTYNLRPVYPSLSFSSNRGTKKIDKARIRPFVTRDLKALLSNAFDTVTEEYILAVLVDTTIAKKDIKVDMLEPWIESRTWAKKFIDEVDGYVAGLGSGSSNWRGVEGFDTLVSYVAEDEDLDCVQEEGTEKTTLLDGN